MKKFIFIFLIALFGLYGCAMVEDMGIEEKLPPKQAEAEKLHEEVTNPQSSAFVIKDDYYLAGEEIPFPEKKEVLPPVFNERLTLVEPLYLNGVADKITSILHLPVAIAPDVTEDTLLKRAMPLDHSGSLELLLDAVASYYGLFWKYDDGQIQFFRTETRSYSLLASMSTIEKIVELSSKAEGSSGSSDSEGSSSTSTEQTVKMSSMFAAWEEAVNSIKEMLSDDGKIAANKASGEIIVTDAPGIIRRVDRYMAKLNDKHSRQVAMNIKIISYMASDTRNRGIEADLAFTDSSGFGFNISGGTIGNGADGTGSLTAAILESDATNKDMQRFFGSQLLINALRDRGKVSVVDQGSGIVQNNMPINIKRQNHQSYLKSVSSTTNDAGTTTSTLEDGSIATGFSLQATPHIQPDNRIVLEYSLMLSELNLITEFETGDQKIQLPDTTSRIFTSDILCRPGQTIVLAGYAKSTLNNGRKDGILAWGSSEEDSKEIIIIAIDINDATLSASR